MLFGEFEVFLASILTIFACGRDPILDRVEEMTKPSSESTKTKQSADLPAEREKKKDNGDVRPQPNQRDSMKEDGPKITISGTIIAENCPNGPIRLNVSDGDQSKASDKKIEVIADQMNLKPGPFSITVNKLEIPLYIDGFCDADGDKSPGPTDPKGVLSNALDGNRDHTDVILTLTSPPTDQ